MSSHPNFTHPTPTGHGTHGGLRKDVPRRQRPSPLKCRWRKKGRKNEPEPRASCKGGSLEAPNVEVPGHGPQGPPVGEGGLVPDPVLDTLVVVPHAPASHSCPVHRRGAPGRSGKSWSAPSDGRCVPTTHPTLTLEVVTRRTGTGVSGRGKESTEWTGSVRRPSKGTPGLPGVSP